jgi:hypothetical protein
MKHIKLFEQFTNEAMSHYIKGLVDILSNADAMEMAPNEFAEYCEEEFGIDPEQALELFDAYWSLGAKDRFQYNERQWVKFLSKLNID